MENENVVELVAKAAFTAVVTRMLVHGGRPARQGFVWFVVREKLNGKIYTYAEQVCTVALSDEGEYAFKVGLVKRMKAHFKL